MNEADPLRRLIEAAAEGDDVALGRLVQETQASVWRVCQALGTPGEEEDLVQETYLRALRSLGSYRGDGPAMGWLFSIARNVCADHVRRHQRTRRLQERLFAQPVDHIDPGDPSAVVHHLLQHLPPNQREAFVLTQVLGMSYQDAATTIDCPIGTIRSRVARARTTLAGLVRLTEAN